MHKYITLASVFLIVLTLLNLATLFDYPIEGGLIIGLLAGLWFGNTVYRHSQFHLSKSFALAFLFAACLLGYARFSYQVPANYFMIYTSLLLIFLALLLYSSLRLESARRQWENSLILAALTISLVELIEIAYFFVQYRSVMPTIELLKEIKVTYRISGLLFVHPNVLAGFLNFVWPIILVRLIHTPLPREKGLWFLALVLFGVIFYFTISRGGVVGALLGGGFLFYRFVSSGIARNFSHQKTANQRVSFLLPLGIGIFLIFSLTGGVFFRAINSGQIRLSALSANRLLTILDALSSGRGSLWQNVWKAFLEKPLFGHGNAGFPIAYLQSADLPPGFLAASAHNLWLNIAVEYGLIGLICFVVVSLILFGKLIGYLHRMRLTPLNEADAYLASFLAFLGHHIFDAMLWVPTYLGSLLILCVLLVRYALPFGEWQVKRKTFLLMGLGVLLVAASIYAYLTTIIAPSYLYYNNQFASANEEGFKQRMCALADRYPKNALYSFQCSHALTKLAIADPVSPSAVELINSAVRYQERGVSLDPYWPPQQANLALLYWLKGDKTAALEEMRQAAQKTPKNILIWLNLGWMEEQVGNQQAALDAYTRVTRLNPLVAGSAFPHFSDLFSTASVNLASWLVSEEEWDSWYEYEVVDRDFTKGVISLALGDLDSSLTYFQASGERFKPPSLGYYAHLAYAQWLAGKQESAYQIAYELALLDRNNLSRLEDPLLLSCLGWILLENKQDDLAYSLLMNSYNLQTRASDSMYYSLVYRQPILQSDLSPLLIRNLYLLDQTRPAWEWFTEQAHTRESVDLRKDIFLWYNHIAGLASLEWLGR